MYEQIEYVVNDPVATITLNRPDKLNAWTEVMDKEVRDAFQRAENDPQVVGIILTGAGRAFCSGADLSNLETVIETGYADTSLESERPGDRTVHPGYRMHYSYIASLSKPVIAAIHGACAGMAMPICTFCDFRFASDKAVFLTAFSQRGLVAEWGSSWILSRLIGMPNAMDLLISSRKVFADEALAMGLVNRVYPADDLLPEANKYIQQLAKNCSPKSMATMKRQLYEHWQVDLGQALNESMDLMKSSFNGTDFKEGVQAFLEKRTPNFSRLPQSND